MGFFFIKLVVVKLCKVVETSKWAVVNLNLGSCKMNLLKVRQKLAAVFNVFIYYLLVKTGYLAFFVKFSVNLDKAISLISTGKIPL